MRTINISQTQVAAYKLEGKSVKEMADSFGILVKEMRDVLVGFGFAKPTARTTDYVINPVFDFNVQPENTHNNAVESPTMTLVGDEMVQEEYADQQA